MRKLLIKKMVLAAMAAASMTVFAFAAEIGTGVITASSLRMRSEPSTSASTIMNIKKNTQVSVHDELDGWYKIVYKDKTGYVSADYVAYTANPAETEPAAAPDVSEEKVETEETAETEGTQVASIGGNKVNFRTGPSASSDVIEKLNEGTEVELVSTENGWCQIIYGGQTGYVSAEYVCVDGKAVQNSRGIVIGSCVNVRSGPATSNSVVTKVYAGTIVDLLDKQGNWYSISFDGKTGYISADYVREYKGNTASSIGEEVAALALSYVGVPYVYGGASPSGFDCSGFTLYVFKQFGYSLSHSASAQWNNSGEYVERSDLQPGDLVLFNDPARNKGKACSHVGIYIGNNEFVHASSSSSGGKQVRVSSLTESYYNKYYKGAKRIG